MTKRCVFEDSKITVDGVLTVEATREGLHIKVTEPVNTILPWEDGGLDLAYWVARLVE